MMTCHGQGIVCFSSLLLPLAIPIAVLQQDQYRVQLFDGGFQFADGVGGQFLRRGQFVGVFETFVFEPLEAVEFEVAGLDVGQGEAAPAVAAEVALLGRRVLLFAFGLAVGVGRSTSRIRRSARATAGGLSW